MQWSRQNEVPLSRWKMIAAGIDIDHHVLVERLQVAT
jgi:hypothetical protein